jgi:hypothetical protein
VVVKTGKAKETFGIGKVDMAQYANSKTKGNSIYRITMFAENFKREN